MIKLHAAYGSPFVRKALYVLAVKDLPFEHIQQMPFTGDAQYLKINPLGKIPSLQDGDLTLCDSTVICEYLDDSHPTPAVYPAGAADKARARWLEELADSRVTELAAGIFFQRYMRAIVMKKESDEELVEKIMIFSIFRVGGNLANLFSAHLSTGKVKQFEIIKINIFAKVV